MHMIMLLPTARNRTLCCCWLLPQKKKKKKTTWDKAARNLQMVWQGAWTTSKKVSHSSWRAFEFLMPLTKESQRTGAKRYLCAWHTKHSFLFALVQPELSEHWCQGRRFGQQSRWSRGLRGAIQWPPPKERSQICYCLSPHKAPLQSHQICVLVSPALLAEVRLTPETKSSIICWSKGVFCLPILNLQETWKAIKNNLHPKHKCWQILPHLQKNNPLWRSVNILVPFPFLKKRQLSGLQ